MNELLVRLLISTGVLSKGQEYDFDFYHQFIEMGNYDAKPIYKKLTGYSPEVAVTYSGAYPFTFRQLIRA